MKAYYAHPVSIYHTIQEVRDIKLLNALGFEVEDPNTTEHAAAYEKYGMGHFVEVAKACDLCAFRAFPSGEIGSGIAAEIAVFTAAGKPVIELPSGVLRRTLSVEETKEMLRDSGAR
jgi:hypothetical protein